MSTVRGQNRAGRSRFGGQPGEDSSLPPVASARQLTRLWQLRDTLYTRRKAHGVRTPISEREMDAIIRWRRSEAETLTGIDRSVALSVLSRWAPPPVMA